MIFRKAIKVVEEMYDDDVVEDLRPSLNLVMWFTKWEVSHNILSKEFGFTCLSNNNNDNDK